jgi:hypothetical protein
LGLTIRRRKFEGIEKFSPNFAPIPESSPDCMGP